MVAMQRMPKLISFLLLGCNLNKNETTIKRRLFSCSSFICPGETAHRPPEKKDATGLRADLQQT